jgi:phosphoglycolate phosphatase-like HAD superfamily hydrolase
MWDWDGCLVNTMPNHTDLAADCIVKHFRITKKQAKKKYLETAGIPFCEQLVEIFPTIGTAHDECAKEYRLRKIFEVYGNPANFPETKDTINGITANCGDFIQMISSSTEECLIEEWALRNNLAQNFFRIYGYEHGSKNNHIAIIRKMFPDAEIIFISDSSGDMKLDAEHKIGVQAKKLREKFFEQGADVVLDGPITAKSIIWAICQFF